MANPRFGTPANPVNIGPFDTIVKIHGPKTPIGGSITATWFGSAGPFESARFDAFFPDIGFFTNLTDGHDASLGVWLSFPLFLNLDPLPPGGAGELIDGDVRIDVGLGGGFTGLGTFTTSATATLTNGDISPRVVGIAIVKFTERILLPPTNPGNVQGFVGSVIASSVASLDPGDSQGFVCNATGDAYTSASLSFPSGGGLFAVGIVGGAGPGSWTLTHLAP